MPEMISYAIITPGEEKPIGNLSVSGNPIITGFFCLKPER